MMISSRRRLLALGAAGLAAAAGLAVMQPEAPAQAAQPPLSRTPDGRPLVLTFGDDFDSFRRLRHGRGVWRTTFRDGKSDNPFGIRTLRWNKELQLYVDPDFAGGGGPPLGLDPFRVRNGLLEISAQPAPPELVLPRLGGFRYISGLITTQPSFSQTYGYFEMRARLPVGKGVWPAFWLLPLDLSWPPEIDVMESIGDPSKVYVTAHSKGVKAKGIEARVTPDEFHVYAVAWDPQELVWFIDGREVGRQPTPPDMHKPMYMLANVAIGGNWAGAPDATTPWPARFTIDYIRAYRFAP